MDEDHTLNRNAKPSMPAARRAARLEAALRENLRRRKDPSLGRETPVIATTPIPAPPGGKHGGAA